MSHPRNDLFISNIHEQLPDLLRLASGGIWNPELWLSVEWHRRLSRSTPCLS
jgi:hypothetical protein